MQSREDVTRLLTDMSAGKSGAREELFSLLYNELHALAKKYMRRERPGHTLQATALVHEAFLRLGGEKEASWESRVQFMKLAARAMRRVLIDYAHRKGTDKRGGGRAREIVDEAVAFVEESSADLVALDSALSRLSEVDPRSAQVVELRFFGGFTIEETAKVMGISPITIKRDWRTARAWLKTEIGAEEK